MSVNSVGIPVESHLKRNLRQQLSAKYLVEYQNGRLGCYDEHTIFYDIFIKEDRQNLVAMGPPLLNLAESLLPVSLQVGSACIPLKQRTYYKKLCVFEGRLPEPLERVDVKGELIFANTLRQSIELKIDNVALPMGKTLVTVQKNNEIRWIQDWILYYRKVFGVEHVYIYDNNSSYQNHLESLISLPDVRIIPWNFPYGIAWGSGNKFCQVGALNHFNLRFGRDAIMFNFDIDELLICQDIGVKRRIDLGETMRFASFELPFDPSLSPPYSFQDLKYRFQKARNNSHKYTSSCKESMIFNVHYVDSYACLPRFINKVIPKRFKIGPVVSTDKAYFLHYRGITTNWKAHIEDRLSNRPPLNKLDLVLDESATAVLLELSREQLKK